MANSDVELEYSIERLLDLVEEGRKRGSQLQPSICMVPRIYRDQNPKCFDPQVVSIGPIHRRHENVVEHEGLKGAYMYDLLDRFNSPGKQILQTCHMRVSKSSYIDRIKSCYAWKDEYPRSDDDIANMMVTDACFILEFILKNLESNAVLVAGNLFMSLTILTDLILIENQIPFFVLQDIFDHLTLSGLQQLHSFITRILPVISWYYYPFQAQLQKYSLITLLLPVLNRLNRFTETLQIDNHGYEFKHILEILHKSFQPHSDIEFDVGIRRVCHSVVELDRAGLKFKPNRDGNWALAMDYEPSALLWPFRYLGKPTLRMPNFYIYDKTELLLRNLIAYEQSYPHVDRHYFTSFAVAMDMLVDTTEDVSKLAESNVIVNDLGSNEIAAKMINTIANDVTYIRFIYSKQWQQLDDYYKSYWPKNMARLRGKYFGSPWSVIALVAGIVLFALTAIQTIFAVMSD